MEWHPAEAGQGSNGQLTELTPYLGLDGLDWLQDCRLCNNSTSASRPSCCDQTPCPMPRGGECSPAISSLGFDDFEVLGRLAKRHFTEFASSTDVAGDCDHSFGIILEPKEMVKPAMPESDSEPYFPPGTFFDLSERDCMFKVETPLILHGLANRVHAQGCQPATLSPVSASSSLAERCSTHVADRIVFEDAACMAIASNARARRRSSDKIVFEDSACMTIASNAIARRRSSDRIVFDDSACMTIESNANSRRRSCPPTLTATSLFTDTTARSACDHIPLRGREASSLQRINPKKTMRNVADVEDRKCRSGDESEARTEPVATNDHIGRNSLTSGLFIPVSDAFSDILGTTCVASANPLSNEGHRTESHEELDTLNERALASRNVPASEVLLNSASQARKIRPLISSAAGLDHLANDVESPHNTEVLVNAQIHGGPSDLPLSKSEHVTEQKDATTAGFRNQADTPLNTTCAMMQSDIGEHGCAVAFPPLIDPSVVMSSQTLLSFATAGSEMSTIDEVHQGLDLDQPRTVSQNIGFMDKGITESSRTTSSNTPVESVLEGQHRVRNIAQKSVEGFEIELDMSDGAKLGIDLTMTRADLVVDRICEHGLIDLWNKTCTTAGMEVRKGDRVTEVNGVSGDVMARLDALQKGTKKIRLAIMRQHVMDPHQTTHSQVPSQPGTYAVVDGKTVAAASAAHAAPSKAEPTPSEIAPLSGSLAPEGAVPEVMSPRVEEAQVHSTYVLGGSSDGVKSFSGGSGKDLGRIAGSPCLPSATTDLTAVPKCRAIALRGFHMKALNAVFIEKASDPYQVAGRQTYWTEKGDLFLFYNCRMDTWAVEKRRRFHHVITGESHGVAYGPKGFEASSVPAMTVKGWCEWDAKTMTWIQSPGSADAANVTSSPTCAAAMHPIHDCSIACASSSDVGATRHASTISYHPM